MKKFLADWRNIALAVAAVIIVFFLVVHFTGHHSDVGRVVRVGSTVITDEMVINELKHQAGDDVVMKMIDLNLIETFAAQKQVSASRAEVDQVLDFNRFMAQQQNEDYDKNLVAEGKSMDDLRREIATIVLQVKLVVPPKSIADELAKINKLPQNPLLYPTRYTLRQYGFTTEQDAKDALALFQKGTADSIAAGTNKSINHPKPDEMMTVVSDPKKIDPSILKVLAGMKDGQFSAPIPGKDGTGYLILEMIKVQPQDVPTVENRGIIVGQYLMKQNQELALKAKQLEAEELRNVDVEFYTKAYQRAYDQFSKVQDQNRVVNPDTTTTPGGAPGASTAPGAPGVTGTPNVPPPPTHTPLSPTAPAAGH